MTDVTWTIKGREFSNCNCDYGCPCQFNGRPTHGNCQAVVGIEIDEGHHGTTRLDGLKFAIVAKWPGAIHEGKGEVLSVLDERATPEQRQALMRIMSGQDTKPGATIFQVFSAVIETFHKPLFARIDFDVDVDGRKASLNVPGTIEARGEPIRNPVSGEEHRARIELPEGFEFTVAEIGRGWSDTTGPVALHLRDSHAQFANLHMTESGVVH